MPSARPAASAPAPRDAPPHTVLLGCSFAGLEFVYQLARRCGRFAPGALTVVDPRAEHPYVPLVHERVSGALDEGALRFDAAGFCRAVGAAFVRAAAVGVDSARRTVTLDDGRALAYDRLVVAVGSVTAVPAFARDHALVVGAKQLADAARLRALVAEGAARGGAPGAGVPVPVVVVGAGLTGVEWAAELAAAGAGGVRAAVTLVDAAERLLPAFRPNVAARAARLLPALGVRLTLGRSVAGLGGGAVVLDDGSRLPAAAVLWAGGVRPAPVLAGWGLPLTARGHVRVTPRLAARGLGGVYAIGDAARVTGGDGAEWPTMARAIEAMWQAGLLARRFAGGWGPDEGPAHRLRRDFFHGLSLGPRHSLVVYGRWWADARAFVHLRRLLKWGYYARYRLLAAWLGRRGGAGARAPARA